MNNVSKGTISFPAVAPYEYASPQRIRALGLPTHVRITSSTAKTLVSRGAALF